MSKHLFLIVFFALFLSSNIWGSVKDNDQYNAFISVVAKEDIDKEIKKMIYKFFVSLITITFFSFINFYFPKIQI